MFTISAKSRLESDDPAIEIIRDPDPNRKTGLESAAIKNLVIHPVQASTLQNAINQKHSNATSLHLLIAANGKQIAQMVDFDQFAVHARDYDHNSLGIGLVYPGYLTEKPGFFYSKERYDQRRIIFAQSVNDNTKRWYSLYPQEQLDTLLAITRQLVETFGIEQILMRQEIEESDLITGPAFPINRLRQLLQDEGTASELQEETATALDLFLQPGGIGQKLLDQPIPAHTPITVIDEEGGWTLVEVMAAQGEEGWPIGWIEADKVTVKPFEPDVNDDHLLVTGDNRQIKFIAAHEKNYNANQDLEPRFVIIHFTTGTNMMSTIHTFLNPDNGVSTHLLVGRTGQVVQFVPFDKVAFHCGASTWEGVKFLNRFSIGIEVDNAGILRKTTKGHKSRGKLIPEAQVAFKQHWKEGGIKAWQKFTDVQLEVVQKIVKALKEKYPTITEILGHDMINLINRMDPGPLYPLGELREAVLGGPQPKIKTYLTTPAELPIYENIDFQPPKVLPHPDLGILPKNSRVRVKEVYDVWSIVKVKITSESSLRDQVGWVLSKSLKVEDEKSITKFDQKFYEVIPAVEARLPPLESKRSPLLKGTLVRIQVQPDDRWALIAPVFEVQKNEEGKYEVVIPIDKVKKIFKEGWVERAFLEPAENE